MEPAKEAGAAGSGIAWGVELPLGDLDGPIHGKRCTSTGKEHAASGILALAASRKRKFWKKT
jgi:hypothetical protein